MSITRRQFLLTTAGTGIGFILPSFYEKALSAWENYGDPLILPAKDTHTVISAWQENDLELYLGYPQDEPPSMTRREYIDKYVYGGLERYFEELPHLEEHQKYDLDAEVDYYEMLDGWGPVDSPWAKACKLLSQLDLGPDLDGPYAVGGVSPTWGGPGSDYSGMQADDYVSLSLLQERLNQLHTGIRVELA